uniref:Uncharacterized protein n=1 Tax=Sphaerodactylus townsendi TaxID=933632 RepID=A0ACB8F7H4_9SAUR
MGGESLRRALLPLRRAPSAPGRCKPWCSREGAPAPSRWAAAPLCGSPIASPCLSGLPDRPVARKQQQPPGKASPVDGEGVWGGAGVGLPSALGRGEIPLLQRSLRCCPLPPLAHELLLLLLLAGRRRSPWLSPRFGSGGGSLEEAAEQTGHGLRSAPRNLFSARSSSEDVGRRLKLIAYLRE